MLNPHQSATDSNGFGFHTGSETNTEAGSLCLNDLEALSGPTLSWRNPALSRPLYRHWELKRGALELISTQIQSKHFRSD